MLNLCFSSRRVADVLESGVLRSNVARALKDLSSGRPVLLFDSPTREGEVDMVYYAGFVGVEEVYLLRTLAGGLICYATLKSVGDLLGLKYMHELLEKHGYSQLLKKPRYGDVSPFSLYVNHVGVKTGISDSDRALTIRELHRVVDLVVEGRVEEARIKFNSEFYAPGHVPVLLAKSVRERRGHTELATSLAVLAGLKPSVVFAEVLDYGFSMELSKAEKLATERGLSLLTGDEIIEAWVKLCE